MKAIKIILKCIMLFLTAIWGIGCGILFPLVILGMGEEVVTADIANDYVIIVWLITSIIGYVIPAILVMCKLCKTASVMSLMGFIGTLIVYSRFAELYAHIEDNVGPSELYLPCIFITLTILAITVIENRFKIKGILEKRNDEKNAVAPSIFGDSKK